jgi:levansucrase
LATRNKLARTAKKATGRRRTGRPAPRRATRGLSREISVWSAAQVAGIDPSALPTMPVIGASEAKPLFPDMDLWDYWPLQLRDGRTAEVAGGTLWLFLTAPRFADPAERHDAARIRVIHQTPKGWRDCGPLLPNGASPGSREWSGATILDPESGKVTVFLTASGRRGERTRTFEQRLFQCAGELSTASGLPRIDRWSACIESVASDGVIYFKGAQKLKRPRLVRGFRDPFWFRDPSDSRGYLLFTGSLARYSGHYSGAIGLAEARGVDEREGFRLLPPILHGAGLVAEFERPHLLHRDGLYYVFWSTAHRVFAPNGPRGPSALYGMVAPSLRGPYRPLNGSGLVLTNPSVEPDQAYCWQVLADLTVTSFVDQWGMQGRSLAEHPQLLRGHFGGTPAPNVRIAIDGDQTRVLTSDS